MPMTTRGYPYETGADEPGHSLTGGSNGASPILAQVVDADVGTIAGRVTTAEGNITALDGRTDTAEADITALDGRVTTNEGNITAVTGDLAEHEAATTAVHGIADTSALVVTTDPRLSDDRTPTAHAATHATGGTDPIAPGDIGAYPATGGEVDGDVTLIDNDLTVKKADGLNGWRARSSGGAVDFDTVGDVVVTAWGGANFTGSETQRQRWHSGGITYGGVVTFGSTVYTSEQFVHNTDFYAKLGGKNGTLTVQICGRTETPGAPVTGTWAAGDLIIDSAGALHMCTADGTPGTWT